jgi:hypothetical protein
MDTYKDIIDSIDEQFRQRVVASFMKDGRLISQPSQLKKRLAQLLEIAKSFEFGVNYPEKQLNEMLARFHEDFCTLRRELVDSGIFTRSDNVYQRLI